MEKMNEKSIEYIINLAKKVNCRVEVFLKNGIKLLGNITIIDQEGFIIEDFNNKTGEDIICFVDRNAIYTIKIKVKRGRK